MVLYGGRPALAPLAPPGGRLLSMLGQCPLPLGSMQAGGQGRHALTMPAPVALTPHASVAGTSGTEEQRRRLRTELIRWHPGALPPPPLPPLCVPATPGTPCSRPLCQPTAARLSSDTSPLGPAACLPACRQVCVQVWAAAGAGGPRASAGTCQRCVAAAHGHECRRATGQAVGRHRQAVGRQQAGRSC